MPGRSSTLVRAAAAPAVEAAGAVAASNEGRHERSNPAGRSNPASHGDLAGHAHPGSRWPGTWLVGIGLWIGLVLAEMLALSWLFEFKHAIAPKFNPILAARQAIVWGLLTAAAYTLISLSRPRTHLAWIGSDSVRDTGGWPGRLVANVACFGAAVVAAVVFTKAARDAVAPPLGLLAVVLATVLATALSLVRIVMPLGALIRLVVRDRGAWCAAAAIGALTLLLAQFRGAAWDIMAEATLTLAHGLLALYESDVAIDFPQRAIGIGDFWITIDQSCSGYEGIALVSAFISLYLWVFRRDLRMPRALSLLPVGIVCIWLLNAVRIAALVSLGAHVSPDVAVHGFHSQAGWISFLVVTVGLMLVSRRSSFFTIAPAGRAGAGFDQNAVLVASPSTTSADAAAARIEDRQMLAYLLPFMAMMLAAIVAAACAPYDHALYGLKVVAAGVVLWVFRSVYAQLEARIGLEAVLAGLAIGLVWIVTEPTSIGSPATQRTAAAWLEGQVTWLIAVWLAVRALGTVVVVPIVEELAFRGFLYRWVISRRFATVSFAQMSLPALVISSALFGALHGRWLAAAVSGVVFALLMNRSGRLSDPIAAHMVANAVIFAWAMLTWQTALL